MRSRAPEHAFGHALIALCAVVLAGCATSVPLADMDSQHSLLPAGIGVMVKPDGAGVIVMAVGNRGTAAAAGVQEGDVVARYNGAPVDSTRSFYRMVLDSTPGSVAVLEVRRGGATRDIRLRVIELDTSVSV
jgi:putative serine protease PepD